MSSPKLKNGYARMTDAKLIERALNIHQQTSTNTATFANPTPTMPALLDAIQEFQAGVQAAANGDRLLIFQRNVLKQKLVSLLHTFGAYVLMIAGDDEYIVLLAGLTLAKKAEPIVLGQPEAPQLAPTSQPGRMLVSVPVVDGANGYMFQYSTDPELKPESWKTEVESTSTCALTNLTTGTVYFFRVGAMGARGQKEFGDVTTRLAS